MFGYVTIHKSQLAKEDLEQYQAYYCGLCKCLKEKGGVIGQMTLTYDMTFLIVLLDGLYELELESSKERCVTHPTKRHRMDYNEITEYAADMNLLLAYYNLMDDWIDERKLSKLAIAKLLKRRLETLELRYQRQIKAVKTYLEKLKQYEDSKDPDIDLVAGLTGAMLGELLIYKEDEWSEEVKSIGFYLGKFIYLMDAYEDIEKDKKNNNYNPFVIVHQKQEKALAEFASQLLNSVMAECAKAFERLPIIKNAELIRNIIYAGVWTRFELVTQKRQKKTGENV